MWFKMLLAGAVSTKVFTAPNGTKYFGVSGDTFPIRTQLKGLGFRWDSGNYLWFKDFNAIAQDFNAQAVLKSLNISFTGVGFQPSVQQPSQPQVPQNQPNKPQNWYHQNVKQTWYLAKTKDGGVPVALAKTPEGSWEWTDEDGQRGTYTNDDVKNLVESVRDATGNRISGPDPMVLLAENNQREQAGQTVQPDVKSEAPGRIPADRLSENQLGIQNTFLATKQSIMMNALAGTGKTTMLRHLASYKNPNEKWLYLVFGKKNQVDASTGKGKFPNGVEVLTSHAFLGRVLGRSAENNVLPPTDIWNQSGQRISLMLDNMMEQDQTFPRSAKFTAKKTIKQMATLAKAFAINPTDPEAAAGVKRIVDQYQIDMSLTTDKMPSDVDYTAELIDRTLDLMHSCLPGNASSQFRNLRDQDDTLWYAAITEGLQWPRYDVVLADEVQDFNRCQLAMLQKLAQAGARIVAVGDPNQAIFLFRGSDAHAFENVQKLVTGLPEGGSDHALPKNYRCGKKIIDFVNQNTKVNNLEAGKDHDGEVTVGKSYEEVIGGLSSEWQSGGLREPTAMLARTNKPLVKAAMDLMKNDMNFVIIGRDFSRELINHLEKVTGKGRYQQRIQIAEFGNKLVDYVSDLQQKWVGKIAKEAELKEIQDTTEALMEVLDHLSESNYVDRKMGMGVRDSVDFIEYLRKRFGGINVDTPEGAAEFAKMDKRTFVTMSSVHRSKGLEFERVMILDNENFPHPKAKTTEELDQEENLKYVAYTRAMNGLHILAPQPPRRQQ